MTPEASNFFPTSYQATGNNRKPKSHPRRMLTEVSGFLESTLGGFVCHGLGCPRPCLPTVPRAEAVQESTAPYPTNSHLRLQP